MRLVALILILRLVFVIAGNASSNPDTASAAPSATQESPSTAPTTSPNDERLHIAGFDNAEEVRHFLENLQQAEAADDREAMVDLVRLPFSRYSRGELIRRYNARPELLADFDTIFTAPVREQIRAARYETLFINHKGAMIGDGEVWFEKREQIAITAVNPPIE